MDVQNECTQQFCRMLHCRCRGLSISCHHNTRPVQDSRWTVPLPPRTHSGEVHCGVVTHVSDIIVVTLVSCCQICTCTAHSFDDLPVRTATALRREQPGRHLLACKHPVSACHAAMPPRQALQALELPATVCKTLPASLPRGYHRSKPHSTQQHFGCLLVAALESCLSP